MWQLVAVPQSAVVVHPLIAVIKYDDVVVTSSATAKARPKQGISVLVHAKRIPLVVVQGVLRHLGQREHEGLVVSLAQPQLVAGNLPGTSCESSEHMLLLLGSD